MRLGSWVLDNADRWQQQAIPRSFRGEAPGQGGPPVKGPAELQSCRAAHSRYCRQLATKPANAVTASLPLPRDYQQPNPSTLPSAACPFAVSGTRPPPSLPLAVVPRLSGDATLCP